MNKYFGPLNKDWCIYFYFLSIIFFVSFVISLVTILGVLLYKPSELFTFKFLFHTVLVLLYSIVPYFVNRLLYSMCTSSLR